MPLRLNTYRAQKTVHHRSSECDIEQCLCYNKYILQKSLFRAQTKTGVVEKGKGMKDERKYHGYEVAVWLM